MNLAREKNRGLAPTVAGVCWLAVLLLVLLAMCNRCQGDTVPHEAVCRVTNRLGEITNVGSGTLVDKSDAQGLVLTCAHLFTEGVGEIVVEFPGTKSHGARLVDLDRDADLAAVVIANPANTTATVEFNFNQSDQLSACGFGPTGDYRCATGPIVGESNSTGQRSILIGDAVRSGDSGGGVFDSQGRLVAVAWGESAGITYASTGPPLRRFLDRVLGRRTATLHACPNGTCPRVVPQIPVQNPRPHEPRQPQLPGIEKNQFDSLVERVDRLESESNSRHASLTERITELAKASGTGRVAEAVTSLLGISGPTGWAVIAAGSVGGWLIGRVWKRSGAGGRCKEPFRS
ncbi:S1 family peptidase [Bythopirellula goksoeyrii]|uniref:Uncharacterized protein n=1 Tax=Bythopirellula goksoeyrii TaxID=1400387 RepID=A0A5B9QJT1_9BACT|nr:serine protease [Bythopirellula goksoeyrii]QEG37840.1 hypothetical protein Pr1d_51880 [Bythopirellula goksoeyrii]